MEIPYPLRYRDVISPEDIAAGRVNLFMTYKDYVQKVNTAFYDGFLLALCRTPEDFDDITPELRLYAASRARAAARMFASETRKGKK